MLTETSYSGCAGALLALAVLFSASEACGVRTSSPEAQTAAARSAEVPVSEPQSTVDAGLMNELNALRADPPAYAVKLDARRRYFQGRRLRLPGKVPLITNEGVSAVDEAVRVLKAQTALPLVTYSRALASAAADHAQDIGRKGLVRHEGSDGSSPRDRIRRYTRDARTTAEVISFGPEDPETVIVELLVDDGVPNRGHRKILLDPQYRTAGGSCAPHSTFRVVCVIDLAGPLR